MLLIIINRIMATIGDRSSIPMLGMIRRMGSMIGSVIWLIICRITKNGLSWLGTGNHDINALATIAIKRMLTSMLMN